MTPTHPQILARVDELQSAAERADRMVCDLASGKHKWNMCIPPQDSDTDMVLIKPIRALSPLLAALREAVTALEKINSAVKIAPDGSGEIHFRWTDESFGWTEILKTNRTAMEKIARLIEGEKK